MKLLRYRSKIISHYLAGYLFLSLFLINVCDATQANDPIIIGGTISLTGRYTEPSNMAEKACRLWVKEVNQRGGLLGRKVKLIFYDDKSDVKLAGHLYETLILQDKVDFLLSPYSTPMTLAASEVSERHKMVMLAIAAAGESPWQRGFKYLFQLYAPAKRQFIGLLDMMAQKNIKSACILYDNTSDFNMDMANGIIQWADIFKITISGHKAYQDGATQLPGLLDQVKTDNPPALILSAYSPDLYHILRLLTKINYKPRVLAMPIAPAHPDFQKKAGDMADLVFAPSQWEPSERIPFPGTKEFIEKFIELAGHLPSFHAASAYSSCQILEAAVNQTKSLDHKKLRDYIAALDTATVLGRFKVDPTGMQVGHNSFIIQWQNGKKEIVWPDKMKTENAIFKSDGK